MFQRLLKRLARKLDSTKIPYMVIGGQAVLVYGEPRLTKDIDITLGINVDELNRIIGVVDALKLKILVDDYKNFVKETFVLPVMDEKSKIRIDFIFSFSPYERQALTRTNNIKLGKDVVKFASLEDVIIHKIISGRARDLEDIRVVLLKNPEFNREYIEKWLQEFDLSLCENFTKIFNELLSDLYI